MPRSTLRSRELISRSSSLSSLSKSLKSPLQTRYKSINFSNTRTVLNAESGFAFNSYDSTVARRRHETDLTHPSPRLPIELIECIIRYLLLTEDDATTLCARLRTRIEEEEVATLSKNERPYLFRPFIIDPGPFQLIAPFSLASTLFRKIALRLYFSAVTVHSSKQAARLWGIRAGQNGFAWVK